MRPVLEVERAKKASRASVMLRDRCNRRLQSAIGVWRESLSRFGPMASFYLDDAMIDSVPRILSGASEAGRTARMNCFPEIWLICEVFYEYHHLTPTARRLPKRVQQFTLT